MTVCRLRWAWVDDNFDVRVILLDAQGNALADSRSRTAGVLPQLKIANRPAFWLASLPYFRDAQGRLWLFQARGLVDGNTLVIAEPRLRVPVWAIFRDEFMRPMLQAGLAALLLALLLAMAMSRWISAPLRRMAGAAGQVAAGDYHTIPLEGPREVQELGAAFNEMTRRVQASQQSQRDFVANVSHELKTPLTSIQGFAQAILEDATDTPESRRRQPG